MKIQNNINKPRLFIEIVTLILIIATFILAMAMMEYSLILLGICLFCIGIALNNIVIIANKGLKPTAKITEPYSYYIPITNTTRFRFLAEIFWFFSIGDILLYTGIIIMLTCWIFHIP